MVLKKEQIIIVFVFIKPKITTTIPIIPRYKLLIIIISSLLGASNGDIFIHPIVPEIEESCPKGNRYCKYIKYKRLFDNRKQYYKDNTHLIKENIEYFKIFQNYPEPKVIVLKKEEKGTN